MVKLLINTYMLATMVFQKAISCLPYLASSETKKKEKRKGWNINRNPNNKRGIRGDIM